MTRNRLRRARRHLPDDEMLDNVSIAELLIWEAEGASGHRELAFAVLHGKHLWPEEATDVAFSERSLSGLPGLGPSAATESK
jgi:hypothetical protein